ncbi:MAG: hypothetical protein IKK33_11365 [Lachnospiraceae bacterium]|nr:hypothetical protein [Lachnospiraceae bacterium]
MNNEYSRIVRSAMRKRLTAKESEAIARLEQKEAEYDSKICELEAVKAALNEKAAELAKTQALLEAERIETEKKIAVFREQYEYYCELEEKLNALNKKITTSYSTQDIATYLNQIIKDFNQNTESDSEIASYVINNMDVDLKVRIYGDEENSLRFTAPNITETSEDSLSSIKITVQAVPK